MAATANVYSQLMHEVVGTRVSDEQNEKLTKFSLKKKKGEVKFNRSGKSSFSATQTATSSTHKMILRKRGKSPGDNQRHKKIKLPDQDHKSIELDQLNDDCILEIFKYLKLNDLSGMSEMCVFKRLANYYFQRKYPDQLSNSVEISLNDNGEIVLHNFHHKSVHKFPLKSFVGCIPCVRIKQFDRKDVGQMVQFLQTNWNGNLRKISFFNGENFEFFGQIKAVLSGVEVLGYDYMEKKDSEAVNETLKYCPRLKCLQLSSDFSLASNEYTQCPTLEVVEFNMLGMHSLENMTKFLRRNRSVSKLVCSFKYQSFDTWKSKLANVLQLISTLNSVSELYLNFESPYKAENIDWNFVHQELKKLDEKSHFKRLELFISHTDRWRMGTLQSFNGLQLNFSETEDLPKTISTIIQFTQLKSLRLFIPHLDYLSNNVTELNLTLVCKSLSQNLPNLEEVHLVVAYIRDDYFEFVARSPKLGKFVLRPRVKCDLAYENIRNRMDSLNRMRQKLQNACKMIINVCKGDLSNKTMEPWLYKDNLVSLRKAKIIDELPNPDNPLLPAISNEN